MLTAPFTDQEADQLGLFEDLDVSGREPEGPTYGRFGRLRQRMPKLPGLRGVRMRAVGIDEDWTTCECCGKTGLKFTVICVVAEAGHPAEGCEYRFGRICAGHATRRRKSVTRGE